MATSCKPSPTRARAPVLGSMTPAALNGAITCGDVQVAPPSIDLTNASSAWLAAPWNGGFGGTIRSGKSYRVAGVRSTTSTVPVVCCRLPGPVLVGTGLRLAPESGALDNRAGPG